MLKFNYGAMKKYEEAKNLENRQREAIIQKVHEGIACFDSLTDAVRDAEQWINRYTASDFMEAHFYELVKSEALKLLFGVEFGPRRGLSGHQSARMKNDEWLTPPEILRVLGPFDLDPCSPIVRPWPTATAHYTVADDGLAQPWTGRVWCNPPFGREAVKWLRRCAEHGNAIALIPARTETAMFYETVWGVADAVCFLRGRPHFHFVDGRRAAFNSGAPIALAAYGRANAEALQVSALGMVVRSNAAHKQPAQEDV